MADNGQTEDFECRRCGKCCHCGSMWTGSDHPAIKALFRAWPAGHLPDHGQCAMLSIADDGKPACLIETSLGIEFKPRTCVEYPGPGDVCMGNPKSVQLTETLFPENGG